MVESLRIGSIFASDQREGRAPWRTRSRSGRAARPRSPSRKRREPRNDPPPRRKRQKPENFGPRQAGGERRAACFYCRRQNRQGAAVQKARRVALAVVAAIALSTRAWAADWPGPWT